MPPKGRRLALVIASSRYTDQTLRKLQAPSQDATALSQVLADPEVGSFEVKELLDSPSHEVRKAIEAFFTLSGPDDLLLLYFSGHGIKSDDGELYLATSDTERYLLQTTTVPAAFVNKVMKDCRSRRKVLILDCCHSGAFAKGLVAKAGDSMDLRERFEGKGRVVLTSSNAVQYSFEGDLVTGEGTKSVFTHHLVRGLQSGEADLDGDGQINLDELYEYVYSRVVNATPKQSPSKWAFETEGDIFVARSRLGRVPDLESRLAEQYRRAVAAQAAGRWEEALDLLKLLADEHPGYRDVVERLRPLVELKARMGQLGPTGGGWRRAVRRFPFWAAFLFIMLPNAVASYYNYAFNDQALFRDNELRRDVFQTTAAVVNGVAFPVGIGIFIWLALPVARGIRRLRAGEALGDEESGRMRRQCLEMGHRAALLGTGLWAIAGPFYPLALLVNGQSMNAFESVFFVVSLALGGLIGAAYPFFVVTFLWVRVLYPMLLRPGSATPDDLATLGRGDARTWRYLLLTASVPGLVVALAIVALGEHTAEMRAHFSVLVLGSLAGLRAVFWLCSAIQSDIGILKQAVTMSSVASSGAGRSG